MRPTACLMRLLLALALVLQGVPAVMAAPSAAMAMPPMLALDAGGCPEHGVQSPAPVPAKSDCCTDGTCPCPCALASVALPVVTLPAQSLPVARVAFADPATGHGAPRAVDRLRPPIARA